MSGGNEKECKSSKTDTNEQIASNEELIYSEKYDRFFENHVAKSRYIESLYRQEHDLRKEDEIAQENGVFYDTDGQMFFETEREAEQYKIENQRKDSEITSTDIVEADMDRKISKTITDTIKNFFNRIIERIKGKGER